MELSEAIWTAQLPERAGFDLAGRFTSHVKYCPNLLQRVLAHHLIQAEAHAYHLLCDRASHHRRRTLFVTRDPIENGTVPDQSEPRFVRVPFLEN